jgi:hypothetical protein
VLLLLGATLLEFRHIADTLPYPQSSGEPALALPAHRMLTTGDLNPGFFDYPSLPRYLTAIAMAAGFVRASTHLEVRDVTGIGNVGFPYYDQRRPMETARQAFVLISVTALVMTAACAWGAIQRPAVIVLAPLFTLISPLFFYHSWTYLNVDIVGTCFVTMTLAACLRGTRSPSLFGLAVLPGIPAGFSAASKYNLVFVIFPVLLAIWLYGRAGSRLGASFVALLCMTAAFIVAVPHSLLDIPLFLNGLAFDGYHYAEGQPGFDGPPGMRQFLFYVNHFVLEFGLPGMLMTAAGIGVFAVRDPRRTAILLLFPTLTLLLLSQHRVHFIRNVLAIHPIVAVYAAGGLLAAHGWLLGFIGRYRQTPGPMLRAAAGVVLLLLAVPPSHVIDLMLDRTDARNEAVAWLDKAIPTTWTLVVPTELGFDTRSLEASGHQVVKVELGNARTNEAADALLADIAMPSVILVPTWGADQFWPGAKKAEDLRVVAQRWQPVKRFGSEVVQVNHPNAAPNGSPAFGVAPLQLPSKWIAWLHAFDESYEKKNRRRFGRRLGAGCASSGSGRLDC